MEKYKGMTVNERLYASGLLEQFDKAVETKNIEEVIRILRIVELSDESIKPILESKGLYSDKD
jgi:hypothetical protein